MAENWLSFCLILFIFEQKNRHNVPTGLFHCRLCTFKATSDLELKSHREAKHRRCPHCNIRFDTERGMNRHIYDCPNRPKCQRTWLTFNWFAELFFLLFLQSVLQFRTYSSHSLQRWNPKLSFSVLFFVPLDSLFHEYLQIFCINKVDLDIVLVLFWLKPTSYIETEPILTITKRWNSRVLSTLF